MASFSCKTYAVWRVCLWLLAAGLPAAAMAADITGVQVERGKTSERIILQATHEIAHRRVFRLGSPERVVADFPALKAENIHLPSDYDGNLLAGIRFGQFDAKTSRLVLDVSQPAVIKGSYAVQPKAAGSPWLYVLDIAPGVANTAASGKAVAKVAEPQQKPLIVIDAGHGGQDPGTIGVHKTYEKNITLRYARAVRKALLQTGKYRVLLTRDSDIFIPLAQRVKIARDAKADLFISFHADSCPRPEARGLSIYTLSETASDDEAAALATQENKVDLIGGIDIDVQDKDVANILIDLAQRETMNKSAGLAGDVLASLHPKVARLPKPHRTAGFRVLKAPDVPSALIELGFLSNPGDERLLSSHEYETIISQSIVKAVGQFMAKKTTAL